MAETLPPEIISKNNLKPVVLDTLKHMSHETLGVSILTKVFGGLVSHEKARKLLETENKWNLAIAEIFIRRDYTEEEFSKYLLKVPTETVVSEEFQIRFKDSIRAAYVKHARSLCLLLSNLFTEEEIKSARNGVFQLTPAIFSEDETNEIVAKKAILDPKLELPTNPDEQIKLIKELTPIVFPRN